MRIKRINEVEALRTIGFVKPHRPVDTIVVHCTASDHTHHDNLATLREWHMDQRGWSAIGYHYLITFDGKILPTGRDLERTPAAQKGHNRGTITIALSGGQRGKSNAFTTEQFQALKSLCHEINAAYGEEIAVRGHDYYAKGRACPVFDPAEVIGLDSHGRIIPVQPTWIPPSIKGDTPSAAAKNPAQSKTILGVMGMVGVMGFEILFGADLTLGEQAIVADAAQGFGEAVSPLLKGQMITLREGLIGAFGLAFAGLAIWGRLSATQQVKCPWQR